MRRRIVVIALDAAEPSLVRALIDRSVMPHLARILGDGRWSDVTSPADIGSGAVWPTFVSGRPAIEHGIHSEWSWNPEAMSLQRTRVSSVIPFWKSVADAGRAIAVVDVPFAPFLGVANGFEAVEWGAHDRVEGRMQLSPGLSLPQHPFASDDDFVGDAAKLASRCLEGAQLRGAAMSDLLRRRPVDFALITFTEIHHASHALWNTIEDPVSPLVDLFHAVDEQIGAIIESAGDADVAVLSLHGMRPAFGVPSLLDGFLAEDGDARLAAAGGRTVRQRATALFAAAKRLAPPALKRIYYKTLPASTTHRLAQSTMLPSYDWSRTRAFSLPSDQHGWIRINLRGREAMGIVREDQYSSVRDELSARLLALKSPDGEPLVQTVLFPAGDDAQAVNATRLPDLVVHWTAAAEQPPYGTISTRKLQTGQHAMLGFAVSRGLELPARVDSAAFSKHLVQRLSADV